MPDRWDSSLYDDRHSFVWRAGAGLLELLNPQGGERILDLGCGTGHLTAKIAEAGAAVTGMDSSTSMIAQARQNFPSLKFVLADARDFHFDEPFNAVFSNAALHWIHDAESVIRCVAAALPQGGRFVLEMGGKGNIGRIRAAIEETLTAAGYPAKCPWYYPSVAEYSTLLEKHGFEIRMAQTFDRWTKLEHPERGLREWIEMFAGAYFEGIAPADKEQLLRKIEDRTRPELYREGHWWADYRRLRVEAVLLTNSVTRAMNRVCDQLGDTRSDPFVSAAAKRTLERSEWKTSFRAAKVTERFPTCEGTPGASARRFQSEGQRSPHDTGSSPPAVRSARNPD